MNITYAQAESDFRSGLMTQRDFDRFVFVWTWSAPRYSGRAGLQHDSYFNRKGVAAYHRRIARVRKAVGFAPYA
jgi:hypothetical protein